MQFQLFALAFAALAAASPLERRQTSDLCPPLDTPQCCQTDVATVLDLTCESPSDDPSTLAAFRKTCAKSGKTAQCCVLPVDGDALLCDSV